MLASCRRASARALICFEYLRGRPFDRRVRVDLSGQGCRRRHPRQGAAASGASGSDQSGAGPARHFDLAAGCGLPGGSRSALIEVPVAICARSSMRAAPGSGRRHPFVRTLLAVAGGSCRGYEGSPLQDYFTTFAPRSAADALGLSMARRRPHCARCRHWRRFCPGGRPRAARRLPDAPTPSADRRRGVAPRGLPGHGTVLDVLAGALSGRDGADRVPPPAGTRRHDRGRGYERSDAADRDIRGTLLLRPDGAAGSASTAASIGRRLLAALGSSHLPVRLTSQLAATVIRREGCRRLALCRVRALQPVGGAERVRPDFRRDRAVDHAGGRAAHSPAPARTGRPRVSLTRRNAHGSTAKRAPRARSPQWLAHLDRGLHLPHVRPRTSASSTMPLARSAGPRSGITRRSPRRDGCRCGSMI